MAPGYEKPLCHFGGAVCFIMVEILNRSNTQLTQQMSI